MRALLFAVAAIVCGAVLIALTLAHVWYAPALGFPAGTLLGVAIREWRA